ncbi:MAG: hypothetical protein AAGG09_04700 [Pseudomonadota bacterium]
MADRDVNWIGWGIDVVRLWSAKGGGLAFAALFFGWFMTFAEGVPPYLPPAVLLGGGAAAVYASLMTYRVLRIGGSGTRLEGTVGGVDERRRTKNSRTFTEKRAVFIYEHEGAEYRGQSSWASLKIHEQRFGDLEPGNRIALVIDPKAPGRAMPLAEVPSLGWHVR